jgi:hypothetical protein
MSRLNIGLLAPAAVVALGIVVLLLGPGFDEGRILLRVLIALAIVTAGYMLLRISSLAIGLWSAAPWMPIVAGASVMGALFVFPNDDPRLKVLAVAIGFGFAFLGWGFIAVLAAENSTARRSNARAYAQVQERIRELEVRIQALDARGINLPLDGLAQARVQLMAVKERLDPPSSADERDVTWSTGAAYQDLWTAIHRAEEWLIAAATTKELRVGVHQDYQRLAGSPLEKSVGEDLKKVQTQLEDWTEPNPPVDLITHLRLIRRAINEYRDGRWDGLVRATARLEQSTLITAWIAFSLLVLVLALGASRETIGVGAVYFAVGALIGMLAQLRADARSNDAVEDYGLSMARMYQTVLASGLAGVAGVVLVAIAVDTTGAAGEPTTAVSLSDVFSLGNPGQLLMAAVFGLSPQLLIDRLSATAEKYKAQLAATEVGSSAPPAASSGADGK